METTTKEIIYACIRVILAALLLNWLVKPETGFWTTFFLLLAYIGSEVDTVLRRKSVRDLVDRITEIRHAAKRYEIEQAQKKRLKEYFDQLLKQRSK